MRSIDELRAEEARVRAVLDSGAEAELLAIPGVEHVSVGLKQINGTATDEFCIRVYVTQKQDLAAIAPSERIPKRIQGIPTDVNEVKVIRPHVDTARYRPITGGIQITNGVIGFGTLGCLATDTLDGKPVLLTNFHVIGGTTGVPVFQPDAVAGDRIATVKHGQISGTFDAAIADIDAGIATTGDEINGLLINQSNHIAGVTLPVSGMRVFKVGRTTGFTDGKVVDADAKVRVAYDPPIGIKELTKTAIIQCTKVSGCCCCTCNVVDSSRLFSDRGDSGSVVVSEQRMAVALLLGGLGSESWACRMQEVEAGLNISINRTIGVPPHALAPPPAGPGAPHAGLGVPAVSALAAAGLPSNDADDTLWSTLQRRLDESPFGREIGVQVRHHLPEVVELVNHHRAVMVAWQRVQGPAFLAQWMNGIRNPSQPVPREIQDVTMNEAFLRLAAVLRQYGSVALQQSVDAYGLDLMALLDRSTTVGELLEQIDRPVSV